MKQLVILDLDNTLYDERNYFKGVFDSYEQENGLKKGRLLAAFDSISRNESDDILRDTLLAASLYSEESHEKLFYSYYNVVIDIEISKDAFRFLSFLSKNKCLIAILTNGVVAVQENKVRCLGVEKYCNKIFYARDNLERYEKPDKRSFQEVLDHFKCSPSDAIMIGDSYLNDYLGAKNAGLDALWFGGNTEQSIDKLFDSLPFILGDGNE